MMMRNDGWQATDIRCKCAILDYGTIKTQKAATDVLWHKLNKFV